MIDGEFKVGLIFVAGEQNDLRILEDGSVNIERRRIQVSHDEIRDQSQLKDMARTTVRRDQQIIRVDEQPGSLEVRQVSVRKNKNTGHY